MQDGQPYNPFKFFTGIFIPEVLVQSQEITLGAKVVFGRLARYAGAAGECFPKMATLAKAVGISLRQAHRYIAELEELGLISSVRRGSTSNTYQFLWQPILEGDVAEEHVISDMTDVADHNMPYMADRGASILYEESPLKESHLNRSSYGGEDSGESPRLITEEEWPQTTSLVQGRFPSVDGIFMSRLVHAAVQAAISAGLDAAEVTDARLRGIVETSFETDKRGLERYGAGLLKKTVPQIIETLAKRHERAIR